MTSKAERERRRKAREAEKYGKYGGRPAPKDPTGVAKQLKGGGAKTKSELSETAYLLRMTKGTHSRRKVSMPKFSWEK